MTSLAVEKNLSLSQLGNISHFKHSVNFFPLVQNLDLDMYGN